MSQKTNKKLSLNRESLCTLNNAALGRVAAAFAYSGVPHTCGQAGCVSFDTQCVSCASC